MPIRNSHRGPVPFNAKEMPSWLFPDTSSAKFSRIRPKSIDDVENDEEDAYAEAKRRRLNEVWRYNVDRGGGLGVGMGIIEDDDRLVIDDHDIKYARHRIALLTDEDVDKLQPDVSQLVQARQQLDTPAELPPTPIFNRPQMVPPNPQVVAQLQQQQMIQQQQIEQFQRYQIMAQQQAMAAQQQAALAAAAQRVASGGEGTPSSGANGLPVNGSAVASPAVNGMHPPNGRPPLKRPLSQTGPGQQGPGANGNMAPPPARPSLSPTNGMHAPNPQMVNGMQNGQVQQQKPFPTPPNMANLDPAIQQRLLQARAHQAAQAQAQAQAQVQAAAGGGNVGTDNSAEEIARLAQSAGFTDVAEYVAARNRAKLLTAARQAQAQQQQYQAQQQAQQQQQQNGSPQVANAVAGAGFASPQLPGGGLQLKLPPHAAARLATNGQQPQRA
jgi:enhancer of polycomb-like protein